MADRREVGREGEWVGGEDRLRLVSSPFLG